MVLSLRNGVDMCLSPRIGFTWERMTYSSPKSEIERGLFRTGSTNGYKGRKKRKRVNRSFTVRRQRETWRSVNIYTARKEGTSFSPFFFFPLFLLSFFFFSQERVYNFSQNCSRLSQFTTPRFPHTHATWNTWNWAWIPDNYFLPSLRSMHGVTSCTFHLLR